MRICYGIGRKIDIRRCEREQFTKLHTGIKQKLQSSVCSWIIYQGNKVVVLIERLEEEKTIVTTFRNYAEVKESMNGRLHRGSCDNRNQYGENGHFNFCRKLWLCISLIYSSDIS